MSSQAALAMPPPPPSPIQVLYGTLAKTRLYNTFLEYARPYIEHVSNEPKGADQRHETRRRRKDARGNTADLDWHTYVEALQQGLTQELKRYT